MSEADNVVAFPSAAERRRYYAHADPVKVGVGETNHPRSKILKCRWDGQWRGNPCLSCTEIGCEVATAWQKTRKKKADE